MSVPSTAGAAGDDGGEAGRAPSMRESGSELSVRVSAFSHRRLSKIVIHRSLASEPTIDKRHGPHPHRERADRVGWAHELRGLQGSIVEQRMTVEDVQRVERGISPVPVQAQVSVQNVCRGIGDEIRIGRHVVGELLS